ncbi:MAG TPA: glycosyltransferase [Lichenihabitans sp.]|jgi:glycosyltransferase involved in cell wall biosynthesis|nr:glycosyltransferase [Lichenihabitans sp.]
MTRTSSLVVDRTHLGRRASGIERITEELFSDEALAPLRVSGMHSGGQGKWAVAASQMMAIPLAMARRPDTVWAFSGFPPSPLATMFRERCVMYVHDLFLITRKQDLNRAARIYMAPPFRLAIRQLRYFLVNSLATAEALAPYLRPDAVVLPYRPKVRNVFDLRPSEGRPGDADPLILGAIGTVEPRKNLLAAAAIALELGRVAGREVRLHVIGRAGWGEDFAALSRMPHVTLHGFLGEDDARAAIANFDLLVCTSHDEGLGLPLIEAQYAGLQVVAPDKPVFREVLASSGLYIDPDDVPGAARTLAARLRESDWRGRSAIAARENIARWNILADFDRSAVVDFLSERLTDRAGRCK